MKKILIISSLILNLLLVGIIIYIFSFEREDVNKDGTVNAQDLLIVQKYILKKGEKNEKNT